MNTFDPEEGSIQIRMIDAYDAMKEFLILNYGPLIESSGGLANFYADIDRSIVHGGFPPDESTWEIWVQACTSVIGKNSQLR
jgi:hypothetical protein